MEYDFSYDDLLGEYGSMDPNNDNDRFTHTVKKGITKSESTNPIFFCSVERIQIVLPVNV